MRLVKKTVNQDDTSVYHLFYADGEGNPGTDVTFFDIPHSSRNHPGSGEVNEIALRVSGRDSLLWWQDRFAHFGISHGDLAVRDGRAVLRFTDPEGQRLALIDDDADAPIPGGTPWPRATVPERFGIRGLSSITLATAEPDATLGVLVDLLGFRLVAKASGTFTLETGKGGPNGTVYVEAAPVRARARLGSGGVHHVAFRVPTFDAHEAWQRYLSDAGMAVTPVIDRFYFRSIYFREPGGVLYELATDEPGFATDEPLDTLGESLALPPFLEGRRDAIEAGLTPLDSSPAVTTAEYVPVRSGVAP
jgi:glyoxalase family protein